MADQITSLSEQWIHHVNRVIELVDQAESDPWSVADKIGEVNLVNDPRHTRRYHLFYSIACSVIPEEFKWTLHETVDGKVMLVSMGYQPKRVSPLPFASYDYRDY